MYQYKLFKNILPTTALSISEYVNIEGFTIIKDSISAQNTYDQNEIDKKWKPLK